MYYLNLLLAAILFVSIALMVNSGLWNNAITLFNTLTAALLATNFWEPLADWLDKQAPSYTYFWDFLAFWLVFGLSMVVFRAATDSLSRVTVRFKKPVDMAGGIFFACWTGWVMVCFATTTLHTAPLARNFLSGQFQRDPEIRMFFGLAPDRQWLGLAQSLSTGSLGRSNPDAHKFDPRGEFILKYGERRAKFETILDNRVGASSK
jgi:hypothetical protein